MPYADANIFTTCNNFSRIVLIVFGFVYVFLLFGGLVIQACFILLIIFSGFTRHVDGDSQQNKTVLTIRVELTK